MLNRTQSNGKEKNGYASIKENEIKIPTPDPKVYFEDLGVIVNSHYYKVTFVLDGKSESYYITDFGIWSAIKEMIKKSKTFKQG